MGFLNLFPKSPVRLISILLVLAVLLFLIGSVFSSVGSFTGSIKNPLTEKKSVDFILTIENIDNLFYDDELSLSQNYIVKSVVLNDYFSYDTLSLFSNPKDIYIISNINGESQKVNFGDMGTFTDSITKEYTHILPIGTYTQTIDIYYFVGGEQKKVSQNFKVRVE